MYLKFAFEHIQFLEQANGAFVKNYTSFSSTFEHAFQSVYPVLYVCVCMYVVLCYFVEKKKVDRLTKNQSTD